MHSPLPDASALEAGILEDETPSRLSRVQDNVRNLLRTSRFGSVHSSPPASPTRPPNLNHDMPTPPETPTHRTQRQPEVLPSPSAESTTSTSTTSSSPAQAGQIPGILFPPASYRHAVQQMAHQSALFNSRAVTALNHPDLSDPSLTVYVQHKTESRHQRAWKRSRHGGKRHVAANAGSSQCILCVLAALLLSAIVATCMSMSSLGGFVQSADKAGYRCCACYDLKRGHTNVPRTVRSRHSASDHRLCTYVNTDLSRVRRRFTRSCEEGLHHPCGPVKTSSPSARAAAAANSPTAHIASPAQ